MYERMAVSIGADGCLRPGGMALTHRALACCSFLPGARVLDIGCGMGGTLAYLIKDHELNAFGIDPSLTILGLGHARNATLPLAAADGIALPFGDAVWDGVLAECSLSLASDARRMLGECRRVLREQGWLVLSDVYLREAGANAQVRSLPASCCLAGAMTREELFETLAACGFHNIRWEDHSAALKTFAAQLILSCGCSVDQLWCRAAEERGEELALSEVQRIIGLAKPGYFLLAAQKVMPC